MLSISLLVLNLIIIYLLYRSGRFTIPAGIVVFLGGFLTASSGMAPAVHSVVTAITGLLAHLGTAIS